MTVNLRFSVIFRDTCLIVANQLVSKFERCTKAGITREENDFGKPFACASLRKRGETPEKIAPSTLD